MKLLSKSQLQTYALVFSVIGLFGWTIFAAPFSVPFLLIGFVALPIYAFLLVQGYKNTNDSKKYTRNLIIVWLVGVLPFWIFFFETSLFRQSILLDLLLSLILLRRINTSFTTKGEIVATAVVIFIVSALTSSMPFLVEILVLIFYYNDSPEREKNRKNYILITSLIYSAAAFGCTMLKVNILLCVSGAHWSIALAPLGMVFSLFFISTYSGKRGKAPITYSFFYYIYPIIYATLGILEQLKQKSYMFFVAGLEVVFFIITVVIMWYVGRAKLTSSIVRFTNMIQFTYLFFLAYFMEFTLVGAVARSIAFRLQIGAYLLIVASATLFASGYLKAGFNKFIQRIIYYLNIFFAIFLMVCPNEDHILFKSFSYSNEGKYPIDVVVPGIVLIIALCYFAAISFLQFIFCLNTIIKTEGAEKLRCIWLTAGILVPWITCVLWMFGFTKGYQLSNVGVLVGLICDMVAMIHYGMTDPVQLASNNFLDHASDGILILNQSQQVVYFNEVTRDLIPTISMDMPASALFDSSYSELIAGKEQNITIKKRNYKIIPEPLFEANYLQGYIVRINDITAQMEELNAAKSIGYTDSLTRLSTRRYYQLKINDFFQKNKVASLFMLDVDDFKHVNDNFGHEVGDLVLKCLGDTLSDLAGTQYYTCRLGGDEFSMFLPNECRDNQLGTIAQRLIDSFHEHLVAAELPDHITISVGVVSTDSIENFDSNTAYDILYRKADAALYHSKRTGKNRFGFYKAGMEDTAM